MTARWYGPHEIPGLPPCICSSCAQGRSQAAQEEPEAQARASQDDLLDAAMAAQSEAMQAAPDPAEEILAGIGEPLGLPDRALPPYGAPGDGCCQECLGRLGSGDAGVCTYCRALYLLKTTVKPPAARPPAVPQGARERAAVTRVFLIAAGLLMAIGAAHVYAPLILPALACLGLAGYCGRQRRS
jgi:hypothetical protein